MSLGWWSDPLEVEISLDSNNFTNRSGVLGLPKCPVYSNDSKVSGKVKVVPVGSSPVWHYGIEVLLQSSIVLFEDFDTCDYLKAKTTLCGEGYISEATEFNFEIDLKAIEKFDILDTYDGELVSVNYEVIATILRPWYTFEISKSSFLSIKNVVAAPLGDNLDEISRSLLGDAASRKISVIDYPGICELEYDNLCYNIGDTLKGSLHLREDPKCRIAEVVLVFYKVEQADGDVGEFVVKETKIDVTDTTGDSTIDPCTEDSKPNVVSADAPTSSNKETPKVDDGSSKRPNGFEGKIPIEFKISAVSHTLAVTVEKQLKEVEINYSVRYYLRVKITDAKGDSHWNTNEIPIYRSSLQDISQGV
mmetsp:Transcript_10632/g.12802  ORF Transcript_10632/g.12802 Transcript_10632/m.12802 type:complete len:362 (-) Transcript_10632:94-1179(-)